MPGVRTQTIHAPWAALTAGVVIVVSWPVTDSLALHILQHILLISVLPPILLRAVPGLATGAALSIERGVALVLVGVLLVYAAHIPVAFEADLAGAPMRLTLHGLLLAAGMLIALPISGGRCVAGIAAVALVAVAELGVGALGMWLAWIPDLVYRLPDGQEPRFGLNAGTDQSLAGAFILVLAEPLLALEFLSLFFRALDDGPDDS